MKHPPADERDYMIPSELVSFGKRREAGKVSFFRAEKCGSCGRVVYSSFKFCSQACSRRAKGEVVDEEG